MYLFLSPSIYNKASESIFHGEFNPQVAGCNFQVTDYKLQVTGLMLKKISEIKI